MPLPDAVFGSIMAIDVERFGDPHRDDRSGFLVIEAFYRVLREAFAAASLPWDECRPEDRGDGALVFVPARFATVLLLDPLLGWLTTAVDRHNREVDLSQRFRLRVALHRGETLRTEHGHTGNSVVLACRLLDADALRAALRHARTNLAVIISEDLYDNLVRHGHRGLDPAAYHPVSVAVKRTTARAWIHLPGCSEAPVFDGPSGSGSLDRAGGVHVTGTASGARSVGVKIGKLGWG